VSRLDFLGRFLLKKAGRQEWRKGISEIGGKAARVAANDLGKE
jgi:hypothetical protein